jgi:hypothetical protein
MEKEITLDLSDDYGQHIYLLSPEMRKTASFSDEVDNYVSNLKVDSKYLYVLINALGAGEFYSANRKGDYFFDADLKKYHKTFEDGGKCFRHHDNKHAERSYGDILFSYYNPQMHRVELVVAIDRSKTKDLVSDIEQGIFPATSMGVRVDYEQCSICGNKNKRIDDRCEHLRSAMNKILSDGRKVYAENYGPLKFFDISFVFIPADATSSVMAKLASMDSVKKVAKMDKKIEPTVPENPLAMSEANIPVELAKKRLKKETLERLQSEPDATLDNELSTVAALGGILTPEDYQYLFLAKNGYTKLAKNFDEQGIVFDVTEAKEPEYFHEISFSLVNEKIASILKDEIESFALSKPLIVKRAAQNLSKYAELKRSMSITIPESLKNILSQLAVFYLGYKLATSTAQAVNMSPQSSITQNYSNRNSWLLPLLTAGAGAFLNNNSGSENGGFWQNLLITGPSAYSLNEMQRAKLPMPGIVSNVSSHPVLSALIASKIISMGKVAGVSSEVLTKHLSLNDYDKTYNYLTDTCKSLII